MSDERIFKTDKRIRLGIWGLGRGGRRPFAALAHEIPGRHADDEGEADNELVAYH